jgi:methylglutaconyl-CoA hydratase
MDKNYKYLEVESRDYVTTLWLNRPEVNNAFDENMIDELLSFFTEMSGTTNTRIILIRGRGNHFSAGADLKWMKNSGKMNYDDNYSGAVKLARLFYAIYHCPLITMVFVHGGCYGGANGIVAAADFSFAMSLSRFVFSEVNLGLVPATIAPYVINKSGLNNSVDWMLSARVIHAEEAEKSKLINKARY